MLELGYKILVRKQRTKYLKLSGNDFLDMTPNTYVIKKNKLAFIKIEVLCASNDIIERVKEQQGRKYLQTIDV